MARWPGVIEPNTITHQVGHVIDVLPTCAELAGASYPRTFRGNEVLPVEGKSLVPIFRGRQRPPHEEICWYWSGNRAIRRGKWKLVWEKSARQWELFDLEADRTELDDLADRQPQRVEPMSAAWLAWDWCYVPRRMTGGTGVPPVLISGIPPCKITGETPVPPVILRTLERFQQWCGRRRPCRRAKPTRAPGAPPKSRQPTARGTPVRWRASLEHWPAVERSKVSH